MTYTIARNTQYSSTEIYFDGKPAAQIREAMKAKGMRWHGVKACWYGKVSEEEARAILEGAAEEKKEEKAEAAPEFYTVATEGYMGMPGYRGNNRDKYTGGADCFRAAFKAAGIKGVTVRKQRGGYTDSYVFTVTAGADELKSWEEVDSNACGCRLSEWLYCIDEAGKAYNVFGEKFWTLSGAEREKVLDDRKRCMLSMLANGLQVFHSLSDEAAAYFSPAFVEKFGRITAIINSFNYDESNSMVDYFDCGFYWRIVLQAARA